MTQSKMQIVFLMVGDYRHSHLCRVYCRSERCFRLWSVLVVFAQEEVSAGSGWACCGSERRAVKALKSLVWENRREATAGAGDGLVTLGGRGRSCSVFSSPFQARVAFALLSSCSLWENNG